MTPAALNVFYTYDQGDSLISLYRYNLVSLDVIPMELGDATIAYYKKKSIVIGKQSGNIEYNEGQCTDESISGIICEGSTYAYYADILTARANGNAS
jgi:hypothetical protein